MDRLADVLGKPKSLPTGSAFAGYCEVALPNDRSGSSEEATAKTGQTPANTQEPT